MTPLRRRDLAVLGAALTVFSWLLVRRFYGQLPPLDWWLPLPVGLLAVAEALGARTLQVRLAAERRLRSGSRRAAAEQAGPPVRPVEPMLVARVAVLAQASAYMATVFAGVWAGVLLHTAPALGRLQVASGDSRTGVIGLVLSLGLLTAALWLEHACRVPPGEEERPGPGVRA